ncbi:Ig-like domain-containing protein [Niameybacter massiliensis]|uniref:Ig-like domain-containing protein n=1 Tax=Holtiella tumoricola TaxID=3018743 RepID=A0AA42DNG7_9FIRM|nr:Ig-like domain-containing protein [Holtiella tumoricola]MDA3732532.1 Ig-like domain-containing protein [Holtiella tumoricola]
MSRLIKRKLGYIVAALCVTSMTFSPILVSAQTPNEDVQIIMPYTNDQYEERTSLQPLADGYSVADMLAWSPASDPDARYARSVVPLQDRFMGDVVNPNANPDAKITNCALTNADSNNAPTQGGDIAMNYIFSYWQYIDSYIYWAGRKEGIFAIPSPDVIDSAHKNGVPVVATVGFPWGSGAGYVDEVRAFCQKDENGNFPVADKMLEMMEFYGFDGWFINQESYGCNSQDAQNLVDMMLYMREKKPDIYLSWYDCMNSSGNVTYYDSLTDSNSMYFDYNGKKVMDDFFLNYNWNKSKTDVTVATANKLGRSPFDVFSGLNVQEESYNKYFNVGALLDENGKLRTSLAMYCPNSTLSMAKDVEDFYKHDQIFWVGRTGDPANTDTSQSWVGLANYVADKSAINQTPFVTNFNTGHGYTYSIEGEVSREREWNNRSNQDYLPTWRWMVESTGSKLAADFDFKDAYEGGNSVKFTGNLDAAAPNHVKLFSTDLPVTSSTPDFAVTYKPSSTDVKVQLGLCFGDTYDEKNFTFIDLQAGKAGTWNTDTVSLKEYEGQTIKGISIRIASETDVKDYTLNLGRFAMQDTKVDTVAATDKVTLDEVMFHDAYNAEARIYWNTVQDEDLYAYEVYRVHENGDREYIGMSHNNAYYISPFERDGEEKVSTFEVVSVDKNYNRGEAATVAIDWQLAVGDTEKPITEKPINLALNKPVKASNANTGEPAMKAVDGTVENNSKWCDTNARTGWLEIDLGEVMSIQRWVVKHAEAGGEASNMNTVAFDLQVYDEVTGAWKNVDVVNNNTAAVTDRSLAEPVVGQRFRLNIRNSGSSPWGAIRIYEFELYEEAGQEQSQPHPMHFVKAINKEGAIDSVIFSRVKEGHTVRLYSSIDSAEAIAEAVANGTGVVRFENLDLGVDAGRIYYTTQETDKGESARMSVAYDSEVGDAVAIPTELKITDYEIIKGETSGNYYANVEIHGLEPGTIVNYYESEDDMVAKKSSIPVAEGSTTAVLERILFNRDGGSINLEVQHEGLRTTRFNAAYNYKKEIATTGKIQINVTSTNGHAMQSALYDVYKEGELVGTIGTDNAGVGVSKDLLPGIYTLKFNHIPGETYVPDTKEYTIEITEPFQVIEQDIVLEVKVKQVEDVVATVKQFEAYTLPETVTATMADLSIEELPVMWDKVVDTTEVGVFEFLGTVKNYDKQVKLTLTVESETENEMNIKSIINPQDVTVEYGTVASALNLPEQVTVVLENDTEVEVPVAWDTTGYDGNKAGTYTLSGELNLSRSVTNPEGLKASIHVLVQEEGLAAPVATLTMEGKIQAGVENRVSYTVNLANLEDVNMYEIGLTYDPKQLTITNAPLDLPTGVKIQTTNKPGQIKITFGTIDIRDLIESTPVISFDFKTSKSIQEGEKVKVELETVKVVSIHEDDKTKLHTVIGTSSDNEATGKPAGTDINGDGKVTLEDLSIAMKYYMTDSTSDNWTKAKKCDVNGDNIIDLSDLIAISAKRTDK